MAAAAAEAEEERLAEARKQVAFHEDNAQKHRDLERELAEEREELAQIGKREREKCFPPMVNGADGIKRPRTDSRSPG